MRICAALLAGFAVLVAGASAAGAAERPPVVVVVFDALPIQLLEDGRGQIDAARFPNFAAFAGEGTWYRHATTISESTRFSVPSILDGRRPRPDAASTYAAHPSNLF